MASILIVEDEKAIRNVLKNILSEENTSWQIEEAENGLVGIEKIGAKTYDLVICDIKMPGADGIEVLDFTLAQQPETAIVMISGHGDLETAVDCVRKGAYDFISKPPDLNRLLNTVRNALEKQTLVVENKKLKQKISKGFEMVGASSGITLIKEMIEKVAPTDARVMITGPNGSGKELVAHWLHQKSLRAQGPMVEVNCAAIPSELIESELFGHIKGAFTSAIKDRKGKFELADGGTLFLDEIGDMSLAAQAKVLRALQENKVSPVGSDKEIKVDVRVVAATNKNLSEEIAKGRFREDLYHRLSVIVLRVPPLNDRRDDIPLLVAHFAHQIAKEQNMPEKSFAPEAMEALQAINWTGNIRELRNVVERLFILGSPTITAEEVQKYAAK